MPNNPDQLSQEKKDIFISDHWRQRRRMSYISIAWVIVQTFLWIAVEMMMPGTLSQLGAVIGWSYSLAGVPIMGYFANTAIDTYRNPENNKNTVYPATPSTPKPKAPPGPWNTGV